MAIAQRTVPQAARSEVRVRDFDTSIILGSVAVGIFLLIAIYLGLSGTAPGDFAAMTVYP
jgi:hypothetical protein